MNFICTKSGHKWSALKISSKVRGYGTPPCPKCGAPSVNPKNYGDFICHSCGNGGLVHGMVPKCPDCGSSFVGFDE